MGASVSIRVDCPRSGGPVQGGLAAVCDADSTAEGDHQQRGGAHKHTHTHTVLGCCSGSHTSEHQRPGFSQNLRKAAESSQKRVSFHQMEQINCASFVRRCRFRRNMAVTECTGSRGYKPEAKQAVAMATCHPALLIDPYVTANLANAFSSPSLHVCSFSRNSFCKFDDFQPFFDQQPVTKSNTLLL